jgi:hypothetical protein
MIYTKDPDAVLDYSLDWSQWLSDGDTIASSSWFVSGLAGSPVIDSHSNTTTTTTVWVSGGGIRKRYEVTNRITTVGGRTEDQSIVLIIEQK